MSGFRFFKLHRPWEDWFGMLLGVLIVVSPWFPMQASQEAVDAERSAMILNTFVVGMLVFGLAQLEYVALQRWEEVGEIVLGLWLIVSPFVFGYSDDAKLQIWHAILGGLVVLAGRAAALAGLEPERSGACRPPAMIDRQSACRFWPAGILARGRPGSIDRTCWLSDQSGADHGSPSLAPLILSIFHSVASRSSAHEIISHDLVGRLARKTAGARENLRMA